MSFNEGGSLPSEGTWATGTLVYSSRLTMHQLGTTDANTCADNDLALVKVDAADVSKVNPSVPFWGSPTGIDTAGDPVWTDGNTGDLGKELAFARAHSGISGLQLVNGTEPFDPLLRGRPRLPLPRPVSARAGQRYVSGSGQGRR